MSEKASVTVRIAGEEHTIRANAEPAYTRKCAKLVDERIREIRSKSGLIESHKAAILAALSIADEYFQAVEEAERIRTEVGSRTADLLARVEQGLKAAGPEQRAGCRLRSEPPEAPSGGQLAIRRRQILFSDPSASLRLPGAPASRGFGRDPPAAP